MLDGIGGAVLLGCLGLGLAWIGGAVALHTRARASCASRPALGDPAAAERGAAAVRAPILNALARFDPFPQINGPGAGRAAAELEDRARSGGAAAADSVVRVLGTACGLGVQGSGWIAGDGVVVTNAHVVAGPGRHDGPARGRGRPSTTPTASGSTSRTTSRSCAPRRLRRARRCAMNPNAPRGHVGRDPRLPRERPLRRAARARLGADRRRSLRRTPTAAARCGAGSRRCAASCAHGNSGGPMVDGRGRVVTTIFAASVSDGGRAGFGVPDELVSRRAGRAGAGRHRALRPLNFRGRRPQALQMRRVRVVRTVLLPLAVVLLGAFALPAGGQLPVPAEPPRGTPPRARPGGQEPLPRRAAAQPALPGPPDAPALRALH